MERKYDYIADNISRLMKEKGVSWNELYIEAGICEKTLVNLRKQPLNRRLITFVKVAEVLGVQVWELLKPPE